MTNKRFEQTGDIRAFKVLTLADDALFRSIVDDASARTVREIDDVSIGKSRSGSPRCFDLVKRPTAKPLAPYKQPDDWGQVAI
jgi:hypothetical protein